MSGVSSGARTAAAPPASLATSAVIVNFAAFQLGWFACVLGAAHGMPALGTVAATFIVAFHVARARIPVEELKLVGLALLVGAVWDSTLVAAGWIGFTSGTLVQNAAPHWILALWALLATTLNVSMRWLRGRGLLAAALGAIAGPLSYWAGARLGAVTFIEPAPAIIALAIGWGAMMPALLALARRHDGIGAAR